MENRSRRRPDREEAPWAWTREGEGEREGNDPLAEGVRLFNEGEYFECHEVWEDLWRAERGPLRDLYQGLIKAAVAFYHAERGNFTGAVRVLERGLPQLRPYVGRYRRLDLERFVVELEEWLRRFREWEAEGPPSDPVPQGFPKLPFNKAV